MQRENVWPGEKPKKKARITAPWWEEGKREVRSKVGAEGRGQ